ncbi:MAG: hypothetical protein J6T41_05970, partial [Neisseriaceae bacterium]|nr:hypothetical protein [Neisseriaceae bacterium]
MSINSKQFCLFFVECCKVGFFTLSNIEDLNLSGSLKNSFCVHFAVKSPIQNGIHKMKTTKVMFITGGVISSLG